MTGDASYTEPLRRQLKNLYQAKREENGRLLLPQKYGDQGWYGYTANQYLDVQRDLYLWSMDPADLQHLGNDPWLQYLQGKNPSYPMSALAGDFERLRRRVQGMRQDESTPDTRPSDGAQKFNPVATETLVNLMLGANDPGSSGNVLHARLRYFDALTRRAGWPDDLAALVEKIGRDSVTVILVNTSPVHAREVIVQLGAFAEHEGVSVELGGKRIPLGGRHFTARVVPGAGETLVITMKRYAHAPTAAFPWDR